MTEANARALAPMWAEVEPVKIYEPGKKTRCVEDMNKTTRKRTRLLDMDHLKKRYGILVIAAAIFTIWSILLAARVAHVTESRVRAEEQVHYQHALEAYKAEQARAKQAEYWLSGDASREAFINQIVEKGAHFIAEESAGDQYKQTKLGVAIAREMNPAYPNDLESVMNQPNQWIRNNPNSKITQHDLDIADSMLRPFYEKGIVPADLTNAYVFFDTDTGIARDSYETTATTTTWRFHG